MSKPAKFWDEKEDKHVSCSLCPHNCYIAENSKGICNVRENKAGMLYAVNYGRVSALHLDPIEKKPLRRFYPRSMILSVGGFGCNFHCSFCQNFAISLQYDEKEDGEMMTPADIVALAKQTQERGNIGVAYTYNEPLIGYEFVYDCAKLVHQAKLKNVVVTNGYLNPEPLLEILPFIDAMNIDLKAFSAKFYQKIGGDLEAVKNTIITAAKHCHVEVTTLIIPDENEADIEELAKWLASIDPSIPLHLSRFYPRYLYQDKPQTSAASIKKAAQTAAKYLNDV